MKKILIQYIKRTQLIGVIIGALLSWVTNELTFKRIKEDELKLETQKEIYLNQRSAINRLRELISLSSSTTFYKTPVPVEFKFDIFDLPDDFMNNDTVYLTVNWKGKKISFNNKNSDFFYNDINSFCSSIFYLYPSKNTLIEFRVPSIAKNKAMQKQWQDLSEQVKQERHIINKSIYNSFEKLNSFLKWNPFPDTEKVGDMIQSRWNDKKQIIEWEELNSILENQINNYTSRWESE